MPVTSVDVAREAGVSQATVSRVIASSDKVLPATRQRVLDAMQRIGYSPNLVARAMKTQRSNTIGIVAAQLTNPFYPEALQELNAALARADQRMTLWSSEGAAEGAALEAIRNRMVDGVIFTGGTVETAALRESATAHLPVVMFNRAVEGFPGDRVISDNRIGGSLVAQHLLELDHTDIGLIAGPPLISTVKERRVGFERALADARVRLREDACDSVPVLAYDEGFAAMQRILSRGRPPSAIFCVNDITAIGAVDAIRSAGLSIPEDVAVAGYDDIAMAAWSSFQLTTVRQPIAEMATKSVAMLLERISDRDLPPRTATLPARLIARRSTSTSSN